MAIQDCGLMLSATYLFQECRRKIAKPSIIFMLHCGKAMYENLIKANWGLGLQNLLIIGNAFSSYTERFVILSLNIAWNNELFIFSEKIRICNLSENPGGTLSTYAYGGVSPRNFQATQKYHCSFISTQKYQLILYLETCTCT